jgi:hypothetical protein
MEKTLNIVITNQDFGLEEKVYSDDYRTRRASRGIVFDPKTNKIALAVKTKINEYKLPGGGYRRERNRRRSILARSS